MKTNAYGCRAGNMPFEPMMIERRSLGPRDVQVDIRFCGVCHSDLHTARDEWGHTAYPCVPGHEIIGTVVAVGIAVRNFEVGETVGVGCLVGSCRECQSCRGGLENYCEHGWIGTYNGATSDAPGHTLGGYSRMIVVDQHFVLKITHAEEQLAAAAPLLCAGITTYSPLKRWGAGPGKTVGIVGIGGLGHVGIKIAHAMGAHTVAFTSTPAKRQDALDLGANETISLRDPLEMAKHTSTFDLIIDTIAAGHDLDVFTTLLKRDGTLVMLGVPADPHPSPNVGNLIFGRKCIAGSLIGGIPETQEMLDFCAEHGIVAEIEMIGVEQIDEAYDRMNQSDVRYRFVIDNMTIAD